jgi:hypothetical protein
MCRDQEDCLAELLRRVIEACRVCLVRPVRLALLAVMAYPASKEPRVFRDSAGPGPAVRRENVVSQVRQESQEWTASRVPLASPDCLALED